MKPVTAIAVITFAGAAVAAVFTSASYPIAIWAVGFAALQKFRSPATQCPLMQIAASKERGEG